MTDISEDEFHGEYDGCKTPPEKTTFLDTDSLATQWFSYQNATVGDTIKWEWYAPDETLYKTSNNTYSYVNGCWYSLIYIKGYSAASKLGQWQVKVYRNDELLFTENFTIQKDTKVTTPTPTPTPSPTPTPTPSPTPSPTITPEEEDLLEKYAPILYMHSEERFHPTQVEVMLNYSELYEKRKVLKKGKRVEKAPTLEMLMTKKYNKNKYYLKLIKYWDKDRDKDYWKTSPTVYGREFTKDGKTILQYWFFYIYNDWGTLIKGGNNHEGDWEMIQIILGSGNQNQLVPEKITYSIHEGGLPLEWGKSEVSKHDEYTEHPLVFVTLGGHGSWNKPGDHKWYQELGRLDNCFSCTDETIKEDDEGDILYPNIETFSSMGNTTYKLEDISNVPLTHWVYWAGYWGNQEGKRGFKGPKSPPYIDYIDDEIDGRWKEPIKWGDKPNPSHYTICSSANSEVTIQDLEGNVKRANSYCKPGLLCGYCPNIKIIYSEKDLIFDVYSLDGEEVNLKISMFKRTTGEVYDVEFDWLEIPKEGKATFMFSSEQNPNYEIRIDRDIDGSFDSYKFPDYLEVK